MKISHTPEREQSNQKLHGISLAGAEYIEWASALVWPDTRNGFGESRRCALAYIGNRLFHVLFSERGDTRTLFSLRQATLREAQRYLGHKPGTLLPGSEEDAQISAAAESDFDARPLSDAEWCAAKNLALSGRPKAKTKVTTPIQLDADLLAAMKALGADWQGCVNDALRAWLESRKTPAGRKAT